MPALPEVIQTAAPLLLAHVIADFLLQSDRMIERKTRPATLALHAGLVLLTSALLLAPTTPQGAIALAILTVTHAVIDRIKLHFGDTLRPYLIDQAAHLVTIAAIAFIAPTLWANSLWTTLPDTAPLTTAMLWLAGFIAAVAAGGHAVAKLMAPYHAFWTRRRILGGGLKDAGRMIGQLERGLTYLLVLSGLPSGVAFLIAAKSILRFNATKDDRHVAEYVIIGTLASIGWALLTALCVTALTASLEIAAANP